MGKYAVIGAGPCGLGAAKNLKDQGLDFDGFEASSEVGGVWNINNPVSSVYASAHLISSKTMTEYKDFPMKEEVADYPSYKEVFEYLKDYADHFDIRSKFKFNTYVEKLERDGDKWILTEKDGTTNKYDGVLICNGAFSEPNIPNFKGEFAGEIIHSKEYDKAEIFEGKRVLVVGGGNSACDIAVDAVHRGKKVSMSVRRGYHFVPKYIFGKPADTMGGLIQLPPSIKNKIDGKISKWFTGDPVKLGFPKPDHDLYEVHPIVNSLVLYHLGHGDLDVKKNIDHFEGKTVHFADGTSEEYDLIVYCTGFKLSYPFISKDHLAWSEETGIPNFYLQVFHPNYNNLFILGMIESTGLGWESRNLQTKLVSLFLKEYEKNSDKAKKFIERKSHGRTDMSGGTKYKKLKRMSFYVHKKTYLKMVDRDIKSLQ